MTGNGGGDRWTMLVTGNGGGDLWIMLVKGKEVVTSGSC